MILRLILNLLKSLEYLMGEVSEQWLQVVESPVATLLSVLNNQGIDFLIRRSFGPKIELHEVDESNDVLWVAVFIH